MNTGLLIASILGGVYFVDDLADGGLARMKRKGYILGFTSCAIGAVLYAVENKLIG